MDTTDFEAPIETGRPERQEQPGGPAVIVPLDGSERALTALPVAKRLAEIQGATLHLVHVSERQLPPRELSRQLGLTPEQMAGTVLDELGGSPQQAIAAFACRTRDSMLVMAAHASDLGPGEELGPITREVLSAASCPVVLVCPERGLEPWDLRRILLPHDGSPITAAGFRPAVRLAEQAEASIYVLHVATLSGEPAPGSLPVPPYVDQPQHEWPEWTREFLERMDVFVGISERLQPRLFLSKGEPGVEIPHFAEERGIDLIALSWHGALEGARAATLKQVIVHSPCPVLFAKAPEEEPEEKPGARTIDLKEAGPYLHS